MQTTYRKQKASAILKTARIEVMKAGNAEIVVDLRGHKEPALAQLGGRADGWGGTVSDALVLTDANGLICKLIMTSPSLVKFGDLQAQCERVQWKENAKVTSRT